jgi:hypothetical protein
MDKFPSTIVGGVSLSRMIIGTNWMLGWSHRGKAADDRIKEYHSTKDKMVEMIEAFQTYGVDTLMAPISQQPLMIEAVKYAQDKTGKKLYLIDTPIINVDDTAQGRREAEAAIKKSAEIGSTFCLMHHSCVEQLVNKNKGVINRIDDYTKMIRDAGMLPGLGAHMPEVIVYSDENGYDVETYIQIYNCMGFLMQVEIETVSAIIHNAKKPVMTIKPMAAGRVTPYVGFNFVWNTIRDCDMVACGCFNPDEVHEDVEISLAAIERRFPDIEKRSSPNQNQHAFGNK